MEEFFKFLDKNYFSYEKIGEETIKIEDKIYQLSYPDSDGKIFDKTFSYVGTKVSADYYVYSFGGQYYYLPVGEESSVKLHKFENIGTATAVHDFTNFLGVHGSYELMNSVGNYMDWANKAKFLGIKYLGIAERNSLAGAMKFQDCCLSVGITPIIGEEIVVLKEFSTYVLKAYVQDSIGWNNLLSINEKIVENAGAGINEKDLLEFREGLSFVIDPKETEFSLMPLWCDYYQLDTVEYTSDERDEWYLKNLRSFLKSSLAPMAIVDAYYINKEDSEIRIKLNKILSLSKYESHNQYFKSEEYFEEIFNLLINSKDGEQKALDFYNEAILNSRSLCSKCSFIIDTKERHLPLYNMTDEEKALYSTNEELFWGLIEEGLVKKAAILEPYQDIIYERIEKEVSVIKMGEVIDYFLILWDIVKWCRNKGILTGIGRGSGGGCLIAWLLDLTHINPLQYNLIFERFLNEGRIKVSLPDIDTDFPVGARSEVKEYMEQRYGEKQVCSVGTYTALQLKAAIKDFGRIENLPFEEVNFITKSNLSISDRTFEDLIRIACGNERVKNFINRYPNMINELSFIIGQPKARSIHACAMMIFPKEKDMFHWVPVRKQDGQYISEWEGGELDSAGFLKDDILGLLQLDKFQAICSLIKEHFQEDIDIYSIPLDEHRVFDFFKRGWNGDVFHFGSKGLTGYCMELQPDNMEDLIAAISLYRPGAMENNFHKEYISRKTGEKKVEYFVGTDNILSNTYGVFAYQEQIMELCRVLGGLSLVEADDVRKAMVKKKYEALTQYKDRFIPYYCENFGVTEKYAEDVWATIDKASTYLFNRSHAAAYAITGYIGQWLKIHYPLEYWSVAFSYAKDEDYPIYIAEINQNEDNVKIKQVDINKSGENIVSDINSQSMFWALSSVKQVGDKACSQILEERANNGEYFSFKEFLDRVMFKGSKVNKAVVENLIICGAFDEIEHIKNISDRYSLIQEYRGIAKTKVDATKDLMSTDKIVYDWWWTLLQKDLSGFGWFEYKSLIATYSEIDDRYPYVEMDKILLPSFAKRGQCTTGGFVQDLEVKTSKNGTWCKLILEHNYQFLPVVIYSDIYRDIDDLILSSKGNLLLLSGIITEDLRTKENVLQVRVDSTLMLLSK